MSKVICDICGTTYQDTADCCPICGCSREIASELAKEDFLVDGNAGRSVAKKREIFDFDEVNAPRHSADDTEYSYVDDEEEPEEEEPRHNTFLVVLLTVLIVVLLALSGFLFVKYLLPNASREEVTVPTTEAPVVETTVPVTTQLRIPCQSLALSIGNAELTEEGGLFLLNVMKHPEDTTDELVFVSEDESIATVSADGRITAVGEGETVVTVYCGDQKISCPVLCSFPEETTVATTEATEVTEAPKVTLKLKKNDIRLQVFYYFTLELDCDLKPEDVQWTSEHPYIATVDEKGVVTAIKSGITQITAKYGDQEVKCIVRCYV